MTPNLRPEVPPKKVREVVPPPPKPAQCLHRLLRHVGSVATVRSRQEQYSQHSPPRLIWDQPELGPEMLEWSRGSVSQSVVALVQQVMGSSQSR